MVVLQESRDRCRLYFLPISTTLTLQPVRNLIDADDAVSSSLLVVIYGWGVAIHSYSPWMEIEDV